MMKSGHIHHVCASCTHAWKVGYVLMPLVAPLAMLVLVPSECPECKAPISDEETERYTQIIEEGALARLEFDADQHHVNIKLRMALCPCEFTAQLDRRLVVAASHDRLVNTLVAALDGMAPRVAATHGHSTAATLLTYLTQPDQIDLALQAWDLHCKALKENPVS